MRLVYSLLSMLLSVYELVLVVYVVMSWIHPAANKWTELVRSLVEPVLEPIRRLLRRHLPARWQIMDWSVLVLWLLIGIARRVLMMIFSALIFW
ncbi:MAG: YggT family protein [Aristaeellaceae bacterium]